MDEEMVDLMTLEELADLVVESLKGRQNENIEEWAEKLSKRLSLLSD